MQLINQLGRHITFSRALARFSVLRSCLPDHWPPQTAKVTVYNRADSPGVQKPPRESVENLDHTLDNTHTVDHTCGHTLNFQFPSRQ
ncbi:hypothetical protein RJ55_06167 [Drechmeria coniospora]|nr:hypothetical protein RJ55_06167 [Drechmeria coniospora]